MGSYIKKSLMENENILYEAKVSLWSLLPLIIIGVVTLGLFFIGVIFLLWAFIRYISTELALTDKKIIAKFGFIRRETIEMNLNKAESIQIKQSILGRIFNFGSIVVSGAGNPQAPIPGISNPMKFRKAFLETQN